MAELSVSIRNYIDNVIRLSLKDIQQCAKSREWFLDRIKTEINAKTNQPALFAEEPFIKFGSYFKGTKVADVDEYDILVVIDTANGHYSKNGIVVGTGEGIAKPNHLFDQSMMKADGSGVSPTLLQKWLCAIIADIVKSFNGTPPTVDGSAITARIESKDLALDLVPAAVVSRKADNKRFYCIPDNNNRETWTATCPADDIDRITNIAAGKDDFKNVIRICKRIKDKYALQISSFAIETAVINHVAANRILSYYWNGTGLASKTISCIDGVGDAINTGIISDLFDTAQNLIDTTTNYQSEAKPYKTAAALLNSKTATMANTSQEDLDIYVNALFENEL